MTETNVQPRPSRVHVSTRPTGREDDVVAIRPVKRRVRVSELWRSLDVALVVAGRDLKVKYKQSVLGPAWLILQPVGVLIGLILVFNGVTNVDTGGVPYTLFALTSLAAWTFIQLCVTGGTTVFIMNSGLVRRVAFPRSALCSAIVLANLVPAGIILAAALIGLAIDGKLPLQALLMPAFAAWFLVIAAGIVFLMSALTVRYRDLVALVPFWLQVGLFLTPVGYPLAGAPSNLEKVLALNPLSGVFELWRWCLLGTDVATVPAITAVIGTFLLAIGGWRVFTRMEITFADYI
jgi:ABC-type polysaccharide/polyol phosphate export permease